MENLDLEAIKELRAIMDSRGIEYQTGRLISLTALPNTRAMIDWLNANPKASAAEMRAKAKTLGKSM